MKIDAPSPSQLPQLLALWKDVFGECGGFWELFRETAFSPRRCRCITQGDSVTAALCWLDCCYDGQKIAYLYAVLTHPDHRGQGLCRTLLADTHAHLARLGYASTLLVPETDALRRMYRKLGYEDATRVLEFSASAGAEKTPLRLVGEAEYAALRREFLPGGGVIQEGENLALLSVDARFYAGEDLLLAAGSEGDTLQALELLGNREKAPAILAALGCRRGTFRCPGEGKPFAMFHALQAGAKRPAYFGFAFD